MAQQGGLFDDERAEAVEDETAVARAAFAAAVARGDYDENGYTPAEARAARKRGTYLGLMTLIREGRFINCEACRCWHAPGDHRGVSDVDRPDHEGPA